MKRDGSIWDCMANPMFEIVLNAQQYAALSQQAKALGMDGAEGTLPEEEGVVLGYKVTPVAGDPPSAIVTFTVLKKPFLAPVGMIRDAVKQKLGLA